MNEFSIEKMKSEIEVNYDIKVFDDKLSQPIGESDKAKRRCIFCDKTGKELFKEKAHAISESLGNKSLVQNEECDECNCSFGSQIESEMARFLEFYRSMFRVSGKSGAPQKKSLFEFNDDVFSFKGRCFYSSGDQMAIAVDIPDKIIPQKLYKSLVKYMISLVGNSYRDKFVDTISWLKGGWYDENLLPQVAISFQKEMKKQQPWAVCYVRKNENKSLPKFVLEFHFLFFVFVVIVPYVVDEDISFSNDKDYQTFWNSFPCYKNSKGWFFENWKSNEPVDFKHILNFKKAEG